MNGLSFVVGVVRLWWKRSCLRGFWHWTGLENWILFHIKWYYLCLLKLFFFKWVSWQISFWDNNKNLSCIFSKCFVPSYVFRNAALIPYICKLCWNNPPAFFKSRQKPLPASLRDHANTTRTIWGIGVTFLKT